jgi:hypothetical protein
MMSNYKAVAIAEGFWGEPVSLEEQVEAWAHLIRTGLAWKLQGWFGRTAEFYIASGLIDREGNIDSDRVDDYLDELIEREVMS